VNSRRNERFHTCFVRLPESVKRDAKKAFRLFDENPYHPRLQFKHVHATRPIYSARVNNDGYRAVGIRAGEDILWYWIGPHDEYERVIQQWPI